MGLKALWNIADFWRAMIWISVFLIAWATIFPHFELLFSTDYAQPYGLLWYLLNPLYRNWQIYNVQLTLFTAPVIFINYWQLRKGRISLPMFALYMLTMAYFRTNMMVNANPNNGAYPYDATVILFAPLASINPLFTVLLLVQKIAVGWSWTLTDPHFMNWSYEVQHNPLIPPYILIAFWMIYPNLVWLSRYAKGHGIRWAIPRKLSLPSRRDAFFFFVLISVIVLLIVMGYSIAHALIFNGLN